jgi:hypothetical protein
MFKNMGFKLPAKGRERLTVDDIVRQIVPYMRAVKGKCPIAHGFQVDWRDFEPATGG